MTGLTGALAQFFTPTHLLAVVALGLLAGQHARRMPVVTLAAFALGLAIGSIVIATAVRETPAALALLAIAAFAGIIVVIALPTKMPVASLLAFATGAALALNSPPQALTIPAAVVAQLGTGVAALGTLALVIGIAMQADRPWQRIGVRIVASWIAASAILVLALRLAR
jgi:urease accessory protein